MRQFLQSTLAITLGLTLFLSDTAFSRGRRNGGFIQKGFNPCGWQSCAPRRRILQRPLFPNLRRRMSGGCGSGGGGCGGGGRNFNGGMQGGGQHGGGCGGGGCGQGGGGNFSGGGGQGGGGARPIAEDPIASEPPAGPDLGSNERNFGSGPEGDLDPAPAFPEDDDNDGANPENPVSKGEAIIKASCVKCHKSGNESGGLDLSDLSKVTTDQWKEALRRVKLPEGDEGRMPEGKKLLPDEEADLIAFLEEKAGLKEEAPLPAPTEQAQGEPAQGEPAAAPTDSAAAKKPSTAEAKPNRSFLPPAKEISDFLSRQNPFTPPLETPSPATPPVAQPAPSEAKAPAPEAAPASFSRAMDSAAAAARSASDWLQNAPNQIASGLRQFQNFEERAKEAQAERERNPDNEFTLPLKEAMSSSDSKDFNRVLNEALNRGAQGELLAAIQEERGLPENLGQAQQARLLSMEAQAELGDLRRKTNAELLNEMEKANAIVFGESPDAVKSPVKRRLIEEELTRRQTQVRQQNIRRIQEAEAQRQLETVKGELQGAMTELSRANRGLGKPALKALKRQERLLQDPEKAAQFDVAAVRKAKARAMIRAIDKNKGLVPSLQDPRSVATTPSDVYRVLQAGENIERWIKAYEEALNSLNRLKGGK